MKTKLKKLVRSAKCLVLSAALCAVGLAAFAEEPDAVQLWKDGPYFATCNVGDGATVPGDYGALYTFADNKAADAAKSLGDGWRLPSNDELNELRSKCTKKWETCKDSKGANINGYRFTGKGDYSSNSIFLPAAGSDCGDGREYDGEDGYYWSSTEREPGVGRCLEFREQDPHEEDPCYMNVALSSDGFSVRAVRDTPPTPTPPEPSDEEVVATAEATFVLGPALAVANVTTATHWPWDGKIDVTCDLTGMGKVQLIAALTTNGVTVCTAKAENITGATTINLDAAGGVTNGVKFVWDAKADCPAGFNSTDTKVKVTAKKVVPPPPGQLWKDGPIWADSNLGTSEVQDHPEYGAPYNFAAAGTEVAKLGDGWRLPTKDECQSLIDKCDRTWNDTKKGYTFTGRGDYASNSVFLPAAGYDKGSGRVIAGRSGLYWSSEVRGDFYAWAFFFQDGMAYMSEYGRNYGLSIRVVRDAK